MSKEHPITAAAQGDDMKAESVDVELLYESVDFRFQFSRRDFVQTLGAGILLAFPAAAAAQDSRRRGRGQRGGGSVPIGARLHIANDGSITVFTGKVECGQGSRTELTQAAAEELRVDPERVSLVMADTGGVPDDGGTAGSRTTPSTVPAVREGCAAAREMLAKFAADRWQIDADGIEVRDGAARRPGSNDQLGYGDLASDPAAAEALAAAIPESPALTPMERWQALGKSARRPNARALVTGAHSYPSDIVRPGMLYGNVLRPPSFGARLTGIDLEPAKAVPGVIVVRDDQFVGVAGSSSAAAERALRELAATAEWDEQADQPSSETVYDHLRERAEGGGIPENPFRAEVDAAAHSLRRSYHVPYVQHSPMETRAAVAEWDDGKLTVWTATQMPFRVRGELARSFRVEEERVRVITPDFGGGFGGKHSGECAVEAARLARSAEKPVRLQWTREEEFTWAQFRPAALIEAEGSLGADGKLTSWFFINVNSGRSAVESPYLTGRQEARSVDSDAPLRHGSYRALASTANVFARECLMDELAALTGADPLKFRLDHLDEGRLRDVLEEAARRFGWQEARSTARHPRGVGLACGTEKGSFVAACAEVAVEPPNVRVARITQVFECGKVLNPDNLTAQVAGSIIMGLGPTLFEESRFADGRVTNASFSQYRVPRFTDVPKLDIHLLDRPDLESVGGGETPLIAVAPAVANAVLHATGKPVTSLPIRIDA